MRYVLPDTSLVWNFHVVGRLDLLGTLAGGGGSGAATMEWGLEVSREVDRHIRPAISELSRLFQDPVIPRRLPSR